MPGDMVAFKSRGDVIAEKGYAAIVPVGPKVDGK
jgi:hypothetical protein